MSNANYSYSQVKGGSGSYKYENPIVYSAGVKTLQSRLKLIGYNVTADGKFGSATKNAVDLAILLKAGSNISISNGYTVDLKGQVSSAKTTPVTSQLNQTAASLFKEYLNKGKVKGTSITYKSTLSGNVFYTI